MRLSSFLVARTISTRPSCPSPGPMPRRDAGQSSSPFLGQSHAYPWAAPAPAWRGLHRTGLDVGQHDERRHPTVVGAAGDKTWTLNKKPGTLDQLAVTDAAQHRHSFFQALD